MDKVVENPDRLGMIFTLVTNLHNDIGSVRTEMGQIRTEMGQMRSEFTALQKDVHTEINSIRSDVNSVQTEVVKLREHVETSERKTKTWCTLGVAILGLLMMAISFWFQFCAGQ
ncbi:MAG: hypothetical protein LBT80_05305 [Lactobacillaceae bacterium]|jgi:archaellum component FlaC|nr:hypothetical protein [Lactobacillaceae bacterium]